MKLLLKNISVNFNRDEEAEEDKQNLNFKFLFDLITWKERTVGFGLKAHLKKEELGKGDLHIKKMRIQVFLFKTQHMYNVGSLFGASALQSLWIDIKGLKYQKTQFGEFYKFNKHY